jgi:hypothetical protein
LAPVPQIEESAVEIKLNDDLIGRPAEDAKEEVQTAEEGGLK